MRVTMHLRHFNNSQRTTRQSHSLTIVQPQTKTKLFGHQQFSHAAATLWNALPTNLRNQSSRSLFKSGLKTILFV